MPLSYPTTPIGQFFLESHVLLEQGDELLEHTGRVIIEQDHAGGVDGRFGGIMRDERVRILHILPRRDLHHREAYLFEMRCKFITNRSEEHTSELQSLMRISYAVFCLQKI